MIWFVVWQVISTLVELVRLGCHSESEKDLEILLLRRQLAIFERKQNQPVRLSRSEKVTLVALATKLKAKTGRTIKRMGAVIRIVKPTTLFGWHQQLVRWKWTYRNQNRGGRPRTDRERETSPSWRHLMTHYKEQLLACDFFTVETLFLQTIYVFAFIEIGSRCVHFAGCTAHPNGAWVEQQARQILWELTEGEPNIRFLIRDNDKKFTTAFDTVFRSEGMDVIPTPMRAPNANAYMERRIRSVREECLDKVLIINEANLRWVMREYVAYFNTARPHQGLVQQIPIPPTGRTTSGPLRCRNVLNGIIHDYYHDAA